VKEHTCTPVWEEEFTLIVEEDNSELELVVYNFDNGGHQFVGSVLVRLAEMESGEPIDEWYPLTLREKRNRITTLPN
jgi:Ca2+-dependent lipid-binding protein